MIPVKENRTNNKRFPGIRTKKYSKDDVWKWFWLTILLLHVFGQFRLLTLTALVGIAFVLYFCKCMLIDKRVKSPFNLAYSLIVIGMFCSIVSSHHYEHTSPFSVFSAYSFITFGLYYFVLYKNAPSYRTIEEVLVKLSIVMCIVYILNFIAYQFGVTLRGHEVENTDGEDARLRMEGSLLATFAILYGFNRYLLTNKYKYFIFISLGGIVITLMSFRTMFVALGICFLLMEWKLVGLKGKLFKHTLIFLLFAIIAYKIPMVQNKINYMIEKQEAGNASLSNDKYVRIVGLNYYLTQHFHSKIEYFFGSGIDHSQSAYANKLRNLLLYHHSYVDWGLLGLSWMTGVITVCGMVLYTIKVLLCSFDKKHCYIWSIFVFLALCSILTYEFARPGNFVVEAMLLYLATPYIKMGKARFKKLRQRKHQNTIRETVLDGNDDIKG